MDDTVRIHSQIAVGEIHGTYNNSNSNSNSNTNSRAGMKFKHARCSRLVCCSLIRTCHHSPSPLLASCVWCCTCDSLHLCVVLHFCFIFPVSALTPADLATHVWYASVVCCCCFCVP